MAQKLDWTKFGENSRKLAVGDKKGLKFVELGKKAIGKEHKVRPIGSPVAFFEFSIQNAEGKWKFAIVDDIDNCDIIQKYDIKPREVYAVNVIDRADNTNKILKGKNSIFGEFKSFYDHTSKNPGGISGADFTIKITGLKGRDYYICKCAGKTPLTDAEQEFIKKEGIYKLEDIFKPVPCDKLEEVLELGPYAKGGVAATAAVASKPVAVVASKTTTPVIPEDAPDEDSEDSDDTEKEAELNF